MDVHNSWNPILSADVLSPALRDAFVGRGKCEALYVPVIGSSAGLRHLEDDGDGQWLFEVVRVVHFFRFGYGLGVIDFVGFAAEQVLLHDCDLLLDLFDAREAFDCVLK